MRVQALWLLCGLLLFCASGPAAAQVGYDRPGGDYASTPSRSGDPALCAARCERDSRCRAWAFSYPMTETANAVCWLSTAAIFRQPWIRRKFVCPLTEAEARV